MARFVHAEVSAPSIQRLSPKIVQFELGSGCAEPSRRSECRTRHLQCIWTDRVSAKMGREREKGRRKPESGTRGMQGRMGQKGKQGEERSRKQSRGSQVDRLWTEKEATPKVLGSFQHPELPDRCSECREGKEQIETPASDAPLSPGDRQREFQQPDGGLNE